ncbi:hypothetical protein CRG98_022276 [Punica granatum]|uniref:Uncharacterized protein n=1 Tax=Punica granatum TaxID=22663 RepID=A0A2I0JM29_PUNGR|nr:hypothetical protein CRG98_022276 [Punica granatum]
MAAPRRLIYGDLIVLSEVDFMAEFAVTVFNGVPKVAMAFLLLLFVIGKVHAVAVSPFLPVITPSPSPIRPRMVSGDSNGAAASSNPTSLIDWLFPLSSSDGLFSWPPVSSPR